MGDGWHACNRQPKFCKIAAVAAVPPPEQAHPGASPGTLGEVLYADRSKPRVSETDWVRLVQSVAAGDQPALPALYERTHRVGFTPALRITSNPGAAAEGTLDVFPDARPRGGRHHAPNGTGL